MSYSTHQPGVLALLQCALALPQLPFSEIKTFRQQLAAGFARYSTVHNALYLGMQAASPGMAFLAGYQNAIRCLDPDCPDDELAAFCVSEKGIKKPWDMASRIALRDDGYVLNGQKGYVMLLPNELDRLYVVAKNSAEQLCCLHLPAHSAGISVGASLSAPFVEDIPHAGVSFTDVCIAAEQLMDIDGHQQANKPFRYWEDIHVALAMMAWILRARAEQMKAEELWHELEQSIQLICQLIATFEAQPDYYSIESIFLLDKCHELMDRYSAYLPEHLAKLWLKDRLLLQMGQKIRHLVSAKIAS